MNDDVLEQDISNELGLNGLNEDQQAVFLTEIGETLLQSTITRLVAGFSPEQKEAFDHYLESEPAPEALLKHMTENYPAFVELFDQEVRAFKTEVLEVSKDLEG